MRVDYDEETGAATYTPEDDGEKAFLSALTAFMRCCPPRHFGMLAEQGFSIISTDEAPPPPEDGTKKVYEAVSPTDEAPLPVDDAGEVNM